MLEGLEASVILKSNLSRQNDVFRIDSQYFKKRYLKEEESRSKYPNKLLGEIAFITDGQHGYHEVDQSSKIRHLTAKNAKNWFANDTDADRIAKWVNDNNKRSSLQKDDLILSTRGSVGFCAIVDEDVLPANIDQDVARIKFQTNDILPTVALTYLNSLIGQDWLKRNETGMVQQGVALWRLREMPIPVFSKQFQYIIDKKVRTAKLMYDQSKSFYKQAENLLLEVIGLKDFEPSKETVNIKSFKESFLSSGRLDAEFYQPKYEQIINQITAQNHDKLKNLVKIKKSFEPGSDHYSDEGLPFLRVSDYNKFEIKEAEKKLSPEFCRDNADLLSKLKPQKNTILFSKDGSVGVAHMVREDLELVTSGAILHLTVKDTDQLIPEYLTLVLNSELVQMQAERDAGGSIILHWRVKEIENVVIPIIQYEQQKEISDMVNKSFSLRKQSDTLLEVAKRAVEIAIEQDERIAIDYIMDNISIY